MKLATIATTIHTLLIAVVVTFTSPGAALADAHQSIYTLQADGLACPFCAYGIEKQLTRIDGVDTVSTDIESGTVLVLMRPGANLTEEQAAEAVDKAGFTMRDFQGPDN